jgi:phage head maturation protease
LTAEELDALDYNDVVRKITEIDLVELSVVNTPANADALFTMARAIKLFFEQQEKRSF